MYLDKKLLLFLLLFGMFLSMFGMIGFVFVLNFIIVIIFVLFIGLGFVVFYLEGVCVVYMVVGVKWGLV